jgi:hypothetical protein
MCEYLDSSDLGFLRTAVVYKLEGEDLDCSVTLNGDVSEVGVHIQ